ncbi:hypothetical protein L1F30_04435 [Simiduia sp. 21SJ11W-1]|uniref:hypothetical protein n=1 Tax=Simiduia sp. 21SJ11W-1 TaxID=2909669 RepID=UPI00209CF18C|nr:hypothetical protein [Simiduia sp. 21SJ11W-1]UTA48796.1 hypothetical protein L1F30_04435 [Simiduia sp. 21SJ11W-1]
MIHAAFHALAWGLIAVLVWVNFAAEPPEPRGPMSAMASLDANNYLVVHASEQLPVLGLLRGQSGAAQYRALRFNDWDGALNGRTRAVCGVPRYHGEVVFLVDAGTEQRLVHVQLRNWDKTPKFAVLGVAQVPTRLTALACGNATGEAINLLGLTDSQALWRASWVLPGYELAETARGPANIGELAARQEVAALYAEGDTLWLAANGEQGSTIWRAALDARAWQQAYRIDGFQVTGLAGGPGNEGLSIVTGQAGLGSVWRPLAPWPSEQSPLPRP